MKKGLTLTPEEVRLIFFEWYLIFVAKDPELLTKEDQRLAERLKNFLIPTLKERQMASVNKAILLGRLGKDPESFISADGGTQICHLAVATSRKFKDRSGERKEETDWHNVVIFGRQAEVAQQYLKKGSEVYIEGRLRTHKYVGKKDSIERYVTEIVCEFLQMGARPQGKSAPTTTAAEYAAAKGRDLPPSASATPNEDVPF